MKKMMFLSKNWYFSVQKALIYYTVNKSHHNSFILLVLSHVANFRYVANFRFLTLCVSCNVYQCILLFGNDNEHVRIADRQLNCIKYYDKLNGLCIIIVQCKGNKLETQSSIRKQNTLFFHQNGGKIWISV